MLGRDAGKWGSHPNRYSIGFQHQHSLSAQPEIGFANAADIGANTFSHYFRRRPLPGLGEVPVDCQFRLRIETHEKQINLSGKAGTQEDFYPQILSALNPHRLGLDWFNKISVNQRSLWTIALRRGRRKRIAGEAAIGSTIRSLRRAARFRRELAPYSAALEGVDAQFLYLLPRL
jgi:hypothetical protein